MRVIALVSLVLALSVSSLPVSTTPGSSEISQLGEVKSTLDGAKSAIKPPAPPTPPRSRAVPSVGDAGSVPAKVKEAADQVTGKLDATKAAPGTPNPATLGNVKTPGAADLGASKIATPGSRRAIGATGPVGTVTNVADTAAKAASNALGHADDAKAPSGVAQRATTPPTPKLGGNVGDVSAIKDQAEKAASVVTSKVAAPKGASVPGSLPA
ncbi:hypothetical protein L210DRAFT_3545297 [Boletus edulis BED1]|uniref:Antifreeze protein n=1 Tax=Boletus edulis BED1 TaxID=1328754 RepID=A0AAD4GDJ3_BOLED|nr:hypothetical protein L210DRAFT_3545297 [Boletus edulis BED1]